MQVNLISPEPMGISINDPELEERLEHLAQAQSVPTNKHAMAKAILKVATKDLRNPNAWRHAAKRTDAA